MTNPTPTKEGRASRVSFGDWTHDCLTPTAMQVQHLIARHSLTAETALIVAALAWGGAHHG